MKPNRWEPFTTPELQWITGQIVRSNPLSVELNDELNARYNQERAKQEEEKKILEKWQDFTNVELRKIYAGLPGDTFSDKTEKALNKELRIVAQHRQIFFTSSL